MIKIATLKEHPQYISQLAIWHENEWGHYYPSQSLDDRTAKMQFYLGDTFIPSTFIALEGDQLLGSAASIDSDLPNKPNLTPWLASVFVKPEVRHQGIATKLITHLCDQAKNEQITRLYLFTENQQNFYKKMGWVALEQLDYSGEQVTIMALDL